jgi:SAM-dependent methyltransferase
VTRVDARPPFHEITESWGTRADRQQFELARQRYSTAASLGAGKVLVEVGCGTGYGLARVAEHVQTAIGIDIDSENLKAAKQKNPAALLIQGDGTRLPLGTDSVDALVGLEMFYYLPDQLAFVAEAFRVVREGGSVLLTMPNPEREGFQTSPFSSTYPTASELIALLSDSGFEVELYGAFPLGESSVAKERIRRTLVRLHLIPRTIKGRARMKRVVSRGMKQLDTIEIDPGAGFDDLVQLAQPSEASGFAILVAVAHRPAGVHS